MKLDMYYQIGYHFMWLVILNIWNVLNNNKSTSAQINPTIVALHQPGIVIYILP
jgi:hypothetical protein